MPGRKVSLERSDPVTTASPLMPETSVIHIEVGDGAIGDLILIRAEVAPIDGLLQSTSVAFDESSLTGESLRRI